MDALTQPVTNSLRPVRVLSIDSSCGAASAAVRNAPGGLVPVTRDDAYVAAITESGLRAAIRDGAEPDASIEPYLEQAVVIAPYATGAEALRQFENVENPRAVVVDDGGVVWGVLYPSDLFPKPPPRFHPPGIGGMAAPIGVHLTAGVVSAGPGKWALVLTGAYLATLMLFARVLAFGIEHYFIDHVLRPQIASTVANLLSLLIFAILMRLSPLAGYHAAEHQVVHAIERGENLTMQTVKRMPRVHPRCGTNVATGVMLASLFFGVDFGLPAAIAVVQPIVGIAIGLAFWRRLGSLVQYWITTKPPSQKQLAAGIKSGEKLLDTYKHAHNVRPNPWKSIWNAGMVHVAIGFVVVGYASAFFFNAIHRLEVIDFGLGIL